MLDEATNGVGIPLSDQHMHQPLSPVRRRRSKTRVHAERRWWPALGIIAALLVAGAYWAGTNATSPSSLGKQYAPAPRTLLTAPVIFRRLSETLPVQGTVTSVNGYQVNFGPISVPGAQPIVTQKPLGPGAIIANGSLIAQVAGRPVFAMLGTMPMYRDLTIGDQGPDVAQLQADLAALGFTSYDNPGVFGRGTMHAIQSFYSNAGYSMLTSSSAAGPSPSSSGRITQIPVVPQAELVFIPKLPATVQSSSLSLGQSVTNPAMTVRTRRLQVIVQLTDAQAKIVQVDDAATLYINDAGGAATKVAATVKAIQIAGQEAQSGPSAVLQPMTRLGSLLMGHQVSGTIVIASTKTAVLAVPVAALYTTADSQTWITIIAHDKRVNVPVRVGAETGGYVPVQPTRGNLTAGDHVLVGQ